MKYAVEMGSEPILIKIGSGTEKVTAVDSDTWIAW
jgi:hypothetical protein